MFRRSTYLHIGFQSLRAALLYKTQVLRMLESRLLSLFDHRGNLLKGAKHDHTGCSLLALPRLFAEQSCGERKEIRNRKLVIRIERRLVRQFAFALRPIPLVIPGRVAGVHLASQLVWQITYDEIAAGNLVLLGVFKMVTDKDGCVHEYPPKNKNQPSDGLLLKIFGPVVFTFHGSIGSAAGISDSTGFQSTATIFSAAFRAAFAYFSVAKTPSRVSLPSFPINASHCPLRSLVPKWALAS